VTTAMERTAEPILPVLLDPARSQAIEETGLSAGGDPTMDRLARLASELLGAPRAFVSLVTQDRQILPGMVRHDDPATDERDQPLSASLCQFAVATEEPLVIPDSRRDALVRDMVPVRSGDIGAYAGFPLRTAGGHVLGTLCVADASPHEWDQQRLALLEDLTALAAQEVEQRLTLTRERRIRDLVRRLADQVSPLGDAVESLADIAEGQDEPRLQRYAALSRSRLESVVSLARQLQEASEEQPATPVRNAVQVDLRRIVENSVRSARAATGTRLLQLRPEDGPFPVHCDGLGLERAVVHVLVTALHHSRDDAPVMVRLDRSAEGGAHASPDERGVEEVRLTVEAEDSRVSTGELARIVSRFAAVSCGEDAEGTGGRPAAIRVAGGTVTAETGSVRGRVERDGRLVIAARWPLRGYGAVIPA
jgi:GAF domain-containing protein